jgi:hypothetical protein
MPHILSIKGKLEAEISKIITKTGERGIILTMAENLEFRFHG